jgi:membrane-associated phospholipid phosphatase
MWKYKLSLIVIFLLAFGGLYMYPNAFPVFPLHYLPQLSLERAIPLLPWTFVIYTSDYVLILLVILVLQQKEQVESFARMAFGVLGCCGLFFWLLPTTYPRPVYPPVDNWLIATLMQFILTTDQPHNCFPSMHVALTGVSAWAMRPFGRTVHALFWLWTLAIIVSTLTTKQHYFLDILGGLAVMVMIAGCEWSNVWLRFRKSPLAAR